MNVSQCTSIVSDSEDSEVSENENEENIKDEKTENKENADDDTVENNIEDEKDDSDTDISQLIEKGLGDKNFKQSVFDAIEPEPMDSSDSEEESAKVKTTSTSGVFNVTQLNNSNAPKLTSRKKRAIERSNKRKKIGSNFYEVSNVKNRNRDRKVPKIKRK